jgi:DNA-binding CsgD family transcriptional regulator
MKYPSAMATRLDAEDVRQLFRLTGELRELGNDPAAWRAHLAAALEGLCGAQIVVVCELLLNPALRRDPRTAVTAAAVGNCAQAVQPLQIRDQGIDPAARQSFFDDLYWTDHSSDDALEGIVRLYGTAFTVRRRDLVTDQRWYRSTMANERYRKHHCGDFIMSMVPVAELGVLCSVELFRPWRGPGFSPRDRLLVDLLHGELARDWRRPLRPVPHLTPRQQEVLDRLAAGASEKELADQLGLSIHTVHDHVKAVHRAFGVRSRGELLARWGADLEPPRVRLVAEQQQRLPRRDR